MAILKVENLCKTYPTFKLKNVSFSLEEGKIMGFIGRNGAGKTTTLKAIMNLIHLEEGKIEIFGQPFDDNELHNKTRIAFALGGADYFPFKTVEQLTKVTARFYPDWDQNKFEHYLDVFELDKKKKIKELSSGMKVKYSLAVALSHNAELFILDEPTSGLDPISRDEILYIFQQLVKDGKRSVLFSTHITSDLDKCADTITYIRDGELVVSNKTKEDFIESYRLISGETSLFNGEIQKSMISSREEKDKTVGLIESKYMASIPKGIEVDIPDLESVMVFMEWGNSNEKFIV